MKIYRGQGDDIENTDTKSLEDLPEDWTPSHITWLDGTKDKSGKRHTTIGVQLTSEDVASLSAALNRYQINRIKTLGKDLQDRVQSYNEKRMAQMQTLEGLEKAFGKISSLLDKYDESDEDLESIRKIANHYRSSYNRNRPLELDQFE